MNLKPSSVGPRCPIVLSAGHLPYPVILSVGTRCCAAVIRPKKGPHNGLHQLFDQMAERQLGPTDNFWAGPPYNAARQTRPCRLDLTPYS